MGLIDGEETILCSLEPRHIIQKDSIVIDSVLCINPNLPNLAYMAP
jgi:hypothetical protein